MSHQDPNHPVSRFHTTRWEEVLAARDPNGPEAKAALAELCRTYWYPLYAFVRRKGFAPDQAEDLTQGFLTDGLARNFLSSVDPARGRFRSFLLACFENYLRNQHNRGKSIINGGGVTIVSIDAGDAEARYLREPAHVQTAERLYDRRWALTVIDRSLDRLEAKMVDQGKAQLFVRLKSALLGADDAEGYAKVGDELKMTEGAVKQAAKRMRGSLRELIREEVGLTVADPTKVDDEVRELFTALSQ